MKKKFIVSGLMPAYGKDVNDFAKLLDLGTVGAFVDTRQEVLITIPDDTPQEKLDKMPQKLIEAWETVKGWLNVTIKEIE